MKRRQQLGQEAADRWLEENFDSLGHATTVGDRATILFDSGIRSGEDVVRALALGAKATLAGRAFMYGLAALGDEGPGHVADFFLDEIAEAMRQVGARTCAETRDLVIRHPGALAF